MKHWTLTLTLLAAALSPLSALSALSATPAATQAPSATTATINDITWPQKQRLAVSLSYDDALNSQLDKAVPTLNKHGIKASFYLLLASPVVNERLDEWRAVAKAGHELGNHTLFHPCSAKGSDRAWVEPHNDLDKRTVAQMQTEVSTANTFLKALDGRTERTFTPPCIDSATSDGDYIKAIQDQFVAIKGYEQNLPAGFSAYVMPNGQSGKELIAIVTKAAERGGMVNFIFHGIDADHLMVTSKAHAELIKYLADNRDKYWTDTYLNIMKHVNGVVGGSGAGGQKAEGRGKSAT